MERGRELAGKKDGMGKKENKEQRRGRWRLQQLTSRRDGLERVNKAWIQRREGSQRIVDQNNPAHIFYERHRKKRSQQRKYNSTFLSAFLCHLSHQLTAEAVSRLACPRIRKGIISSLFSPLPKIKKDMT